MAIFKFIKKLLRQPKSVEVPSTKINDVSIPRQKHRISKANISENALRVINRLNHSGFDAYLVGGSVRDLLLGKSPKDFDVATNATPNEIRKLFRNARIIGRRFKIVHVVFYREVIEVTTFRGHAEDAEDIKANEKGMLVRDNFFGSLEEDAFRRDFRINAMYYDVRNASVVDMTGGFADIQSKVLHMIGNPILRFQEDPVRMLRAIRFSAKLQFSIDAETAEAIHTSSHLIAHISNARLFDEMVKFYQCGHGQEAQSMLMEYGLFKYLFPKVDELARGSEYPVNALLAIALESTDSRIKDDKPVTPAFIFAALLWFLVQQKHKELQDEGVDPLPALDQAMSYVLSHQCRIIGIPKRFTLMMREIWLLQYRFDKRQGQRAFHLLTHPRFRAAYDFMALRALAGDESVELAQWWTEFQEVDEEQQKAMVAAFSDKPKRKKRRKKKAPE